MDAGMHDAESAATRRLDTLVNTLAKPDHGNQPVLEAEVIASRAAAEEMATQAPDRLGARMSHAPGTGNGRGRPVPSRSTQGR